ncbi:hypothetical protein SLEP1_g46835 [Rubroshorea leprosula]|uniref:Uncharacterized protein n=1 Tax=Rubroshorea leprosula TaxID=152421 RepID=A0AAV5LNH6_9ROSI|nr:hypothetical protein SLEP1_g46835 [Rubroshorea leprosula]
MNSTMLSQVFSKHKSRFSCSVTSSCFQLAATEINLEIVVFMMGLWRRSAYCGSITWSWRKRNVWWWGDCVAKKKDNMLRVHMKDEGKHYLDAP